MADTRVSEMAALAGADVADGDLLPIVDISAAAGAKNKTLTPVEARIALVTAAAIEAALGYEPATAAQGALADSASQPPTGTGYVHVTSGAQDAAAGNPLVVAATDANATLSSSATVTGSGDATVGLVAQTATGTAAANLGAQALTLGNATFQLGVYAVEGTATAAVGSAANTGNAVAPVSATSYIAGNATANTAATATTGDATANRTATTGTGGAFANTEALITGAGGAEACVDAEVQTPDGDSDALARIRATAGAHVTSVSAAADSTGSSLEVAIEGDVGAAGQFQASDGAGHMVWTTPLVRHAAGVPSGAPGVAELPVAFDSTAVSGGLYFWDGAAWVKCSVIP